MMIANCPRCQDKITVPEGARENSNVACPLCRDEFLLGEVLQGLPPRLILLDPPEQNTFATPATPATAATAATAATPAADTTSTIGILDDVEEATKPADVPAAESPAQATADDSGQEGTFAFADSGGGDSAESTAIRSSRRSRQKSENPIGTMIKVVLGGLMAAPLAQLILWWAFSKDPVKLGPKVSPYVPWIVPKDHRGSGSSQAPTKTNREGLERLVRQESTWSPDSWKTAGLDTSSAFGDLH